MQIGIDLHINVKEPVMFINHSCNSNIMIDGNYFIATKNIKAGEEVVFNYLGSEDVLAEPFKCSKCGLKVLGKLFIEEYPCNLSTT